MGVTNHLLSGMILQVHSYDYFVFQGFDHAAQLSSYKNPRYFAVYLGD